MTAMRKRYGDLHYLWTIEVQEKRLARTGDAVLHWHIIMAFPYDPDKRFDKEDVKHIQKYWKFGDDRNSVEVRPVRFPSVKYLMKYVTKALDTDLVFDYLIRRIGTSRIAGWLKQSWNRILRAVDYLTPKGIDIDMFDDLLWMNGNAYMFYEESYSICGHLHYSTKRLRIYSKPVTEWFRVENYRGDAF